MHCEEPDPSMTTGLDRLDQLFRSAETQEAPPQLYGRVLTRLERQEHVERAVAGGLVLLLGATAFALLVLIPCALVLVENVGMAPALLTGGPETAAQVLALLNASSRTVFSVAAQSVVPLVILSGGSLLAALALNGLWIAAMRRLQVLDP